MAKEKEKPAKYQVTGVEPGPVHHNGVTVDLSLLNQDQLEELYKTGCPYVTTDQDIPRGDSL